MAANQCNCHTGRRTPPITSKYCHNTTTITVPRLNTACPSQGMSGQRRREGKTRTGPQIRQGGTEHQIFRTYLSHPSPYFSPGRVFIPIWYTDSWPPRLILVALLLFHPPLDTLGVFSGRSKFQVSKIWSCILTKSIYVHLSFFHTALIQKSSSDDYASNLTRIFEAASCLLSSPKFTFACFNLIA